MSGTSLTIRLLGGFSVAVGDRVVPDARWSSRRAADLVKLLAIAPRHRMPREQVVETFWPDGDPRAGLANVRKCAFHARHALDLADGVVLEDGLVKLAPSGRIRTDADEFAAAVRLAEASGEVEEFRRASALYAGPLLPDNPYDPWCADVRAELRALHLRALTGARRWERLVEEDPADERAHREIMRARLADGDRAAAIRQFERLRTTLREELGVSAQPETVAVYEDVLNMDGRDTPTPAERARALLAWGMVHWQRADLEEAARAAEDARALAIDAQLPRELADASELLGRLAYTRGAWHGFFVASVDSVSTASDLTPFLYDANMCMCEFALAEPGGTTAVTRMAEDVIRAGSSARSAPADALGRLLRGESALLEGRTRGVRADLRGAIRWHESASAITGWAVAVERLAQLDRWEGHHDVAREGHRAALRIAERTSIPEHLLPFIYGGMLAGEDPGPALAIVEAAEAATAGRRVCDTCAMPLRVGAAIAHGRAGDLGRARAYLADASRVCGMWRGGPWPAAVDEAAAAVRSAAGAPSAEVIGLLERAGARFDAAHRPLDATRCRQAAGALARNAGGTAAS